MTNWCNCARQRVAPRVVQHGRQLQTLVALVAAGFGIALLPASLAVPGRRDIVFKPLAADAPADLLHLDLLMAWNHARMSPVRDRFVEAVRDAMPL